MWRSLSQSLGWILAAAMVIVLSFSCLMQWKNLREREHGVAVALTRGLQQIDQRIEVSNSRWQALLESGRDEANALPNDHPPSSSLPAVKNAPEPGTEASAGRPRADDVSALPPIPQGMIPEQFIRQDLTEILADPQVNATGKELTMVESVQARLELTRAQSQINILDAEIRLDYNLGMEELKQEGAFIEYGPGQKPQTFEGVLTAGELMPGGGVRMFYFYPERFPEIYERKRQKAEIAEMSARKVLAILSK